MNDNIDNKMSFQDKTISFFKENKFKLILFVTALIITALVIILLNINYERKNKIISEKYISAGLNLPSNQNKAKKLYEEIILSENRFYSVLALNTLLEKNLEDDKMKILNYFQILEKLNLTKDQEDLITIKKALYLMKNSEQPEGLKLLEKLINDNSKFKQIAESVIFEK